MTQTLVAPSGALSPAFAIPVLEPHDHGHQLLCKQQRQSNWCWAACVQMILGAVKPMEQWQIVNDALGRTDCEMRGNSSDCNKPLVPNGNPPNIVDVLHRLGASATYNAFPLAPAPLRAALLVSPVIIAFDGSGTEGHVVVISAAIDASDNPRLWVSDPGTEPWSSAWKHYDDVFDGLDLGLGPWTGTIFNIRLP